jgi:hypothetical protein
MARTNSCWRRTWGQEALENNEEACGAVGCLRGGQSVVVDGNLLMEEEAVGEGALPGVMASGSSSKVLLDLQRKTEVRSVGSDGDDIGWCGA